MAESSGGNTSQLGKLNFDLSNYFSNTIIPQLFVDANLILRIFTPPAMKQFSLSKSDVNRHIEEVSDNIKYPTIVKNIKEVIETNNILEKEIQTTDGNWFQMNILPYMEYEEQRTNGVIITFVDITKRLTTMRELEKINADHHILMYSLAHDIRQPISTIHLISDVILKAYENANSEQLHKCVETLKHSSSNLKALVDDMVPNIEETPEQQDDIKRLNIQEICDDVLFSLKEEIKAKKIKVSTKFDVSEIKFPRNYLRSIVYNLVHNAIKFSSPEKKSEIKIKTTKAKDFLIFCVEDNGVGIAEEQQRKIFKKSLRLNKEVQGTGMGLYIIKKMIENNDGRIKLESTTGKGSTFKVFFKQ